MGQETATLLSSGTGVRLPDVTALPARHRAWPGWGQPVITHLFSGGPVTTPGHFAADVKKICFLGFLGFKIGIGVVGLSSNREHWEGVEEGGLLLPHFKSSCLQNPGLMEGAGETRADPDAARSSLQWVGQPGVTAT